VGFEEKPAAPKESPHHKGHCNASMGIYIFNTHLMIPILLADSEDPKSAHDFGKDILPRIISKQRVFAFNFIDENRKTRCTGATLAPWMRTTKRTWIWFRFHRFSTFTTRIGRCAPGSINIRRRNLFRRPGAHGRGARFNRGERVHRSGGRVQRCIVGNNVRVNSYCEVSDSILYNHVNVGRHSRIRRSIIDRHVTFAGAYGDRLRHGSGQAAIPCDRFGNCGSGAPGIADRRTRTGVRKVFSSQ